jgi:hypothetical protein
LKDSILSGVVGKLKEYIFMDGEFLDAKLIGYINEVNPVR